MSENQQKNYQKGWIGKINKEQEGVGQGALELWVNGPLEVKTAPNGDPVGELNMSGCFAGPSGVKYCLGDVQLEDGTMFVKASFWGFQLERLQKLNPQKHWLMRIYGRFETENYTRQDGSVGHSVKIKNVNGFDIAYKPQTAAGTTQTQPAPAAQTESVPQAAAPAPAAQTQPVPQAAAPAPTAATTPTGEPAQAAPSVQVPF